MANILRTLIWGERVSLTLADTTALVNEGVARHRMTGDSALVFAKTLSAMTFMSACLKGETGEISLSVKGNGNGGEIGVSGNRKLYMRGFMENPTATGTEKEVLGDIGSLTIIRDDGYSRPFVGACALTETGSVDRAFEEYFRISEQLPTRFQTVVERDQEEKIVFVGIGVLQPLPFADEETLARTSAYDLLSLVQRVRTVGVENAAIAAFGKNGGVWETREGVYKCNCSRSYLTRVLVSLGEAQMREIIRLDGAVRVHCHYCNTDYEFTEADADEVFAKEE